jgi:hypothetical protein
VNLGFDALAKDAENRLSVDESYNSPVSTAKNGCMWCEVNGTLRSGNPSITVSAELNSVTVEEKYSRSWTLDGIPVSVTADGTLTATYEPGNPSYGEFNPRPLEVGGGAAVVGGIGYTIWQLLQDCAEGGCPG